MAGFNATFTSSENMNATFETNENLNAEFGQTQMVSTSDYEKLSNKPKIEGHTLIGDQTFIELGLGEITPQDIDEIIYGGN